MVFMMLNKSIDKREQYKMISFSESVLNIASFNISN